MIFLIWPKTYMSEQTLLFPVAPLSKASFLGAQLGPDDSQSIPELKGALIAPLVGSGAQTCIAILASDETIRDVVRKNNMVNVYGVDTEREAVLRLRANSRFALDPGGMLVMSVRANSPKLALQLINSFTDILNSRSQSLTFNMSKRNTVFIDALLKDQEQKLMIAADAFKKDPGISEATAVPVFTAFLNARKEVEAAKVEAASAETSLESLRSDYEKVLHGAVDGEDKVAAGALLGPSMLLLTQNLTQRNLDLQDALNNFAEGSPELKQARLRQEAISKLYQNQFDGSAKDPSSLGLINYITAKSKLAGLKQEITSSQQILDTYKKDMKTLPGLLVTGAIAKANLEGLTKSVETLKEEKLGAEVAEDRDPVRFGIIDNAIEDDKPVWPRPLLMTAALFAICLAFVFLPIAWNNLRGASTASHAVD